MAAHSQAADSGPVREGARITSLDLIRGVAVLGILLMNAVSFKFGTGPYFNLSAGGSETWLDWAIGILGEIFVDQKFMGLFSLLFGAGMILFIDRASGRGRRAVLLNLWRNALLLIIGILHLLLWDGDVLTAYALSSVFLIALRKLPNRALITIGVAVFTLSVALALMAQYMADNNRCVTIRYLDTRRGFGLGSGLNYWVFRSVWLFPARIGADSRRRRPVSHRLYEWPTTREDISTDRNGRACRRPATCRNRGHYYGSRRLLPRDCLYWSDSQHVWHDSGVAGIHECPHSLGPAFRQPAQAVSTRSREDGADQLFDPDGAGRACLDDFVGKC